MFNPTLDTVRATTATPTIAATYERVSTRMQGQHGFSLGAQHQCLDDFTHSQGWVLPEHLRFRDGEDADASGAAWDLPGLTAMLEAARRREFQVLAVPDLDRFARSLAKGLVLEEQLKSYGVRVVYQRVPVDDSPEGRLLKNQLFSFAEFEREKTTLRTTMGRRRKAQLGQVVGNGGRPPFGYRFVYAIRDDRRRISGIEPDPITAPIARRILADLRTHSTLAVAADLNDEGIPGPTGGRWSFKAVNRIGVDPVYCGSWVYGKNGRRVSPDDPVGIGVSVPALITRQEWDAIQRALAHRRSTRRAHVPRSEDTYLLRGALTCGHCHGALHAVTNSGIRYYRCAQHIPFRARALAKPVCVLPDVRADHLEAELWRILGTTLLDPDYLTAGLEAARSRHAQVNRLRAERLAVLDAEIGRQRQRLDNIAGRFADAGTGEVFDALMRQARDIEGLIQRLTGERLELATTEAEGLGPGEAEAIEAFAAEVRSGMILASSADRRDIYELLQVRGKVYADPSGVALGRRHRFRVEWRATISLRNNTSGFLKRDDL